jgi:hypothetical protein
MHHCFGTTTDPSVDSIRSLVVYFSPLHSLVNSIAELSYTPFHKKPARGKAIQHKAYVMCMGAAFISQIQNQQRITRIPTYTPTWDGSGRLIFLSADLLEFIGLTQPPTRLPRLPLNMRRYFSYPKARFSFINLRLRVWAWLTHISTTFQKLRVVLYHDVVCSWIWIPIAPIWQRINFLLIIQVGDRNLASLPVKLYHFSSVSLV